MSKRLAVNIGIVILAISSATQAAQNGCDTSCLREKAMSGDGEAAIKLAEASLKKSHMVMVYWYRIAAENGSASGQYNYGMFLVSDSRRKVDCVRALFWFRRAARQGEELADDHIKRLEEGLTTTIFAKGCSSILTGSKSN